MAFTYAGAGATDNAGADKAYGEPELAPIPLIRDAEEVQGIENRISNSGRSPPCGGGGHLPLVTLDLVTLDLVTLDLVSL
jgi:hypothetical protein